MKKCLLFILLVYVAQVKAQTHRLKQPDFNKHETSNIRLVASNYQQTQSVVELLDSVKTGAWDSTLHSWKTNNKFTH